MASGTTIKVAAGATNVKIVEAVYAVYAEKIRSPKGWFGSATVTVGEGEKAVTVLVKAVSGGFDVYKKTAHVPVTLTPTIG